MTSGGHYTIILMAINQGAASTSSPGSVSLDDSIVSVVSPRIICTWLPSQKFRKTETIHYLLLVMRGSIWLSTTYLCCTGCASQILHNLCFPSW